MKKIFLLLILFSSLTSVSSNQEHKYTCQVALSSWINKDTVLKSPVGINNQQFKLIWDGDKITLVKLGEADFILETQIPVINKTEFQFFARGMQTLLHFDKSTRRAFMTIQTPDNITSTVSVCKNL